MASPISTEQRSAQESRKQFDIRLSNMVSRLERTDAIFFYKHVSKSMATEVVHGPFAYSLELPHEFIKDHDLKFSKDVDFMTTASDRTWPIKLTVRIFKNSRTRVFAYGPGGWKDFLMENHIKVGDILIISLIAFSRFRMLIGRSPVEVHSDDNNNADQGNSEEDNSNQDNAVQAPVRCLFCNNCPRFTVTIRLPSEPEHPENHFYLEKDLSLVVPRAFWDLHSHMLQPDELRLKGPTETVTMVKVERTYPKEVQKVCLMHSGWKAFLLANNLAIGDVLEFSLIANSSFTVDVVETDDH